MKSCEEIRAYLIDLLNQSLPASNLYGGEVLPSYLLDFLAFIDEREPEAKAHMDALCTRWSLVKATSSISGAFTEHTHLPATHQEIGSVYAEIAFKMGYLKTDRTLNKNEFAALCSELRANGGLRDFNTEDVVREFGVPSWKAGANRFWPCVYLYFCNDVKMGAVAFDFWNEINFEDGVGGRYGELAVLRDFRIPAEEFGQEFTFTPLGRKITQRD